jgi:hypothetical protein
MTKFLAAVSAVFLVTGPACAHMPSVSKATGPTQSIKNSTQYTAMNWMCPNPTWADPQACYGYTRAIADALVGGTVVEHRVAIRMILEIFHSDGG